MATSCARRSSTRLADGATRRAVAARPWATRVVAGHRSLRRGVLALRGASARLEWYPRMDVLMEIEGTAAAIESAIAAERVSLARSSWPTRSPLSSSVTRRGNPAARGRRRGDLAGAPPVWRGRELAGEHPGEPRRFRNSAHFWAGWWRRRSSSWAAALDPAGRHPLRPGHRGVRRARARRENGARPTIPISPSRRWGVQPGSRLWEHALSAVSHPCRHRRSTPGSTLRRWSRGCRAASGTGCRSGSDET